MTNTIEPYLGPLPDGWTGGKPVTKFWRNKFMHLYRVQRACASCGVEITLDVTKAALDGTKQNAGLKMKNCPACRHKRRHGGTGSRGGTSRPMIDSALMPPNEPAPVIVHDTPPVVVVENAADAALRMANQTMKEELEGLYAQVADLRARLAQYELPAAMKDAARDAALHGTGFTKTEADGNVVHLPWETVKL